jgi:RNA polymerase sigma-70 factor, ECF subfamily
MTPAMSESHQNGSGSGSRASAGTSRSLLERARAADADAWDRIVSLYGPLVIHWCRRWDLQEQDIADVFQDVFQAVATHIGDFRKDRTGDTFRGWLRIITQNKVHDHFRRLGREPGGAGGTDAQLRLAELPAPFGEAEAADRELDSTLFRQSLELIRGEFEDRTWQAFWRTAVDDVAPKDVAIELCMSPGSVRVAKCRVLRRLREEFGDLLD